MRSHYLYTMRVHLSKGMVSDQGLPFAHAGHSLGRAGGQSSLLLQPLLYFLNGQRRKQEVNIQLQKLQASSVSCNVSKSQLLLPPLLLLKIVSFHE